MIALLALTAIFIVAIFILQAYGRRREIMENWPKYRGDVLVMLTAFLYKPDEDSRTRWQFAEDNFREQTGSIATGVLKTSVMPFLNVFHLLTSSLDESMNGVENAKKMTDTMAASFQSLFEIFQRRFGFLFHKLALTFYRLMTAMERTWAVAMNTLWQSIATTNSIMSTMDLIIKIIIIILIILVVMLFFFFIFLWPFIPLVLSVVGIITTAGLGGAVGGMASAFCFGPQSPILLANGKYKPIRDITVGDVLSDGGKVTAYMKMILSPEEKLFNLHGVLVTGSHIYYDEKGVPHPVHKHPDSFIWSGERPEFVYCLNTSTHKIHIQDIQFSDWEEFEDKDIEGLQQWNRYVFETLNPGVTWKACDDLDGEAVLHPATLLQTPKGPTEIGHIRPGDLVMDADGNPTIVTGVIVMSEKAVKSKILWVRKEVNSKWIRDVDTMVASTKPYVSLFTSTGTFKLYNNNWGVRDFTDVGSEKICESYSWVLDHIRDHQ